MYVERSVHFHSYWVTYFPIPINKNKHVHRHPQTNTLICTQTHKRHEQTGQHAIRQHNNVFSSKKTPLCYNYQLVMAVDVQLIHNDKIWHFDNSVLKAITCHDISITHCVSDFSQNMIIAMLYYNYSTYMINETQLSGFVKDFLLIYSCISDIAEGLSCNDRLNYSIKINIRSGRGSLQCFLHFSVGAVVIDLILVAG